MLAVFDLLLLAVPYALFRLNRQAVYDAQNSVNTAYNAIVSASNSGADIKLIDST